MKFPFNVRPTNRHSPVDWVAFRDMIEVTIDGISRTVEHLEEAKVTYGKGKWIPSRYQDWSFTVFWDILLKPWRWQLSQDHFYYDCPHCTYYFGPFQFYKTGDFNCKKCIPNGDF